MTGAQDLLDIAYVDVIDVCQLKCPTCVRGIRLLENSSGKMPLDKFSAVLDKLKSEGYRRVGLFNWTEPFLNRTLEDYVAEVKSRELICWISTTLSLRHIDNLEDTLLKKPDVILVSMSGMDQQTYEINHVGGDLSYVMQNLREAAAIVRRHELPTSIVLRFIKFGYNASHEEQARLLAEELGVYFEVIEGIGNPANSDFRKYNDRYYLDKMAEAASQTSPEAIGQTCALMFDQIAIDCNGDLYTCCAMPTHPSLRIGSYLDLGADEILLRRWTHSFCKACTMPRREATASDKERLYRAVSSRLHSQTA